MKMNLTKMMIKRWGEASLMMMRMMQLKLKQKIKSVENTGDEHKKYRQMSQNTSQMIRQRMNVQHVRIMSKGQ